MDTHQYSTPRMDNGFLKLLNDMGCHEFIVNGPYNSFLKD